MFVSNNTDGIQTGENLWHCAAKHTSSAVFFLRFLLWFGYKIICFFLNLWSHKRFYIQFVTLSQFKRNIFMLRYHLEKTLLRNSVLQNTIPLIIRLIVFTMYIYHVSNESAAILLFLQPYYFYPKFNFSFLKQLGINWICKIA